MHAARRVGFTSNPRDRFSLISNRQRHHTESANATGRQLGLGWPRPLQTPKPRERGQVKTSRLGGSASANRTWRLLLYFVTDCALSPGRMSFHSSVRTHATSPNVLLVLEFHLDICLQLTRRTCAKQSLQSIAGSPCVDSDKASTKGTRNALYEWFHTPISRRLGDILPPQSFCITRQNPFLPKEKGHVR